MKKNKPGSGLSLAVKIALNINFNKCKRKGKCESLVLGGWMGRWVDGSKSLF